MLDSNQQFIVLSYGRSASVMLAHRIGNLQGHQPSFINLYSNLSECPVQHTHLLFSSDKLDNFCRVFSLRKDPVQTILSFLFVERFKVYHKVSDEYQNVLYQHLNQQTTDLTLTPFVFNNWHGIQALCDQYSKWHEFYSNQLLANDYVVFYEDILNHVENPSTNYQLVYNNKDKILLNYNEVVEYIDKNFKQAMLDSQMVYARHQNSTNIYKFLSRPV